MPKDKIYFFSIINADAPPPPLQIAAAPSFASFLFKTLINVTTILEPELPRGWPRETAPPKQLTLSESIFKSFLFAIPTTENASFSSK